MTRQILTLLASTTAILLAGCGSSTNATTPHELESNIFLVASKSFCVPTGIDDAYTGDGHLTFYLTFRNSGLSDGTIDAVPERDYDDGQFNESPADEVSVDVAERSTLRVHTEALTYKAHEHDVIGCKVLISGRPDAVIRVEQ